MVLIDRECEKCGTKRIDVDKNEEIMCPNCGTFMVRVNGFGGVCRLFRPSPARKNADLPKKIGKNGRPYE